MARKKTSGRAVVGLEIEASHLAAVQLRPGGTTVELAATAPVPPGLVRDGEVVDVEALAATLKAFFRDHKLPRQVRLGVANQRIVVRALELPPLDDKELRAAVRFEAQEQVPMPLEQAVLDYQRVRTLVTDEGPRAQVMVVAARRDMIERLIAAARGAGLRPVGIDLSAFAMIRSLYPGPDPEQGAVLYVNVAGLTNIAVAQDRTCLFTRVVSVGFEGMAGELAERSGLTLDHARQWLVHVGLDAPLDQVEGDPSILAEARNVLVEGTRRIADEARNSLDYYSVQPEAVRVGRGLVCGPALAVPGFAEHLSTGVGIPIEPGTVEEARVGALDGVARERVAVAAGLALEERAA